MSELEWNVRAPEQPGGIDLLRLSVRSFRGDVRQATPADLIAALKANAAACGEVMAAMGWVTDQALAVTGERAEQAERSLATVTAERDEARARLRDVGEYCRELQAHALPTDCVRCGGVGAEPPCCPESGPCECCGGWTAHKRLVVAEPSALRAKLAEVDRERDEAHAALRDCATRLGNGSAVSPKASHAFHCAVATEVGIVVPALRARLAKTEQVVEAAREDAQHCPHACSPPCPFDRAVARTRAALRALDSPVVAGTDSGGSGAATPEGGHAAPTGGPMPPPEPAGSSLEATRDLQAPATRAELEELRREVLETVADVCLRADDNAQAPWPWPLTRLGAELRRRVERLEGG